MFFLGDVHPRPRLGGGGGGRGRLVHPVPREVLVPPAVTVDVVNVTRLLAGVLVTDNRCHCRRGGRQRARPGMSADRNITNCDD